MKLIWDSCEIVLIIPNPGCLKRLIHRQTLTFWKSSYTSESCSEEVVTDYHTLSHQKKEQCNKCNPIDTKRGMQRTGDHNICSSLHKIKAATPKAKLTSSSSVPRLPFTSSFSVRHESTQSIQSLWNLNSFKGQKEALDTSISSVSFSFDKYRTID